MEQAIFRQTDASRRRRRGSLVDVAGWKRAKGWREGERRFLSGRSPTIDVIRLNLIALCLQ